MSVESIAKRLIQLCNAGKPEEAAEELYALNIVSSAIVPLRTPGVRSMRV